MSFEELIKLAEEGNEAAQIELAACYRWGFGSKKNMEKAFKLYKKLSEEGNEAAQIELSALSL